MRSLLLLFIGLLTLSPARAEDTVRCGSSLVSSDTTVENLVEKCGEPARKKVEEEEVRAGNAGGGTHVVGTTVTETWFYDRGSRAFGFEVVIVDGKVKSLIVTP